MSAPRRDRPGPGPVHRPKKYLNHVADEYEALGNVRVAVELRRCLLGHGDRWREIAGARVKEEA